jgi:hypothetical protein
MLDGGQIPRVAIRFGIVVCVCGTKASPGPERRGTTARARSWRGWHTPPTSGRLPRSCSHAWRICSKARLDRAPNQIKCVGMAPGKFLLLRSALPWLAWLG